MEINEVETKTAPNKRSLFGMANGCDTVYVFGGYTDSGINHNDLWYIKSVQMYVFKSIQ